MHCCSLPVADAVESQNKVILPTHSVRDADADSSSSDSSGSR